MIINITYYFIFFSKLIYWPPNTYINKLSLLTNRKLFIECFNADFKCGVARGERFLSIK